MKIGFLSLLCLSVITFTPALQAQELTAETFMAALQAIARFQANSAFTTWLLGIARHKSADHFRRRRETVSLDLLGELPHPDGSPVICNWNRCGARSPRCRRRARKPSGCTCSRG